MRGKKAGLYRGNGTKDEGTLRSKRLTTEWSPCVPTKLMTLGLLVWARLLGDKSNRHSMSSSRGDHGPIE